MQGKIIKNRYFKNTSLDYSIERLKKCFLDKGVKIDTFDSVAMLPLDPAQLKCDAAIMLDKDKSLATWLEKQNIQVFNSSHSIEICDNKFFTYLEVVKLEGVKIVPTISSPKQFLSVNKADTAFLDLVVKQLSFPLVVKKCSSSLGENLFLVKDYTELKKAHLALSGIEHIYQKYLGEFGSDIRVYTVGGQAVACCKRTNETSFISNVEKGGKVSHYELSQELKQIAELIAKQLKLDFGSIDFLLEKNKKSNKVNYIFLEANSNAFFKGLESLGYSIAEKIVEYICKKF